MNEQVILTQTDNGIEVLVHFKDSKKNAVDLTGKLVRATLKYENYSDVENEKIMPIINPIEGVASLLMGTEDTNYDGLCTAFCRVEDEASGVYAQENVYMFIQPLHGGN